MQNVLYACLAFALATIADYLSTMYYRAVHAFEVAETRRAAFRARARTSAISGAICLVGVAGLYGCVAIGWWLVVPELAGCVVGPQIALRR